MFEKGDIVIIHMGGDSKPGVVVAETKGETTKVEVEYNDVIKGKSKVTISFNNANIEKK